MHVDQDDVVAKHLRERVEEEGIDVGALLGHLLAVVLRESSGGISMSCCCS